MDLYFFDATYEVFKAYYGNPVETVNSKGKPIGAVRTLLRSIMNLVVDRQITHLAFAFDHVIESFRNSLYPGYKTGEGLPEELAYQLRYAEEALQTLGFTVWPMVEFEADDALASGAKKFINRKKVEKIYLATPDKDLAQCVIDPKVVCWDRLRDKTYDEAAVVEKFGVPPSAIADFLALTGDAADGIPGIPKWGKKSAGALLTFYGSIDKIPRDEGDWAVSVRGAKGLCDSLNQYYEEALLFKQLTTLRVDAPVSSKIAELKWQEPHWPALKKMCTFIQDPKLFEKVTSSHQTLF